MGEDFMKNSTKKIRLDNLLVEKGIIESREKAKALILEGKVYVNGIKVDKAGKLISIDSDIKVSEDILYVSRGGIKLERALSFFNIDVKGKIAMDVGASTGGFTDCLLQHGASKVYAVDVGYGQLAWKLRTDKRVVPIERTNIRKLEKLCWIPGIDIATVDVSFISLIKVLPKVIEFLTPEGEIVALIKPQFEAGRENVGKGGVVRDKVKIKEVIEKVKKHAEEMGLVVIGATPSPIKGPKGNLEHFIYLKRIIEFRSR
jgi:23S rRNA (cytidine1920-2'-O)/16S rRNA (cytidine1409-2'-O)-methyltransferase